MLFTIRYARTSCFFFFHILLVLITLMLLLFGLSLFTRMKKSFSGCNHASDFLLYTYFIGEVPANYQ